MRHQRFIAIRHISILAFKAYQRWIANWFTCITLKMQWSVKNDRIDVTCRRLQLRIKMLATKYLYGSSFWNYQIILSPNNTSCIIHVIHPLEHSTTTFIQLIAAFQKFLSSFTSLGSWGSSSRKFVYIDIFLLSVLFNEAISFSFEAQQKRTSKSMQELLFTCRSWKHINLNFNFWLTSISSLQNRHVPKIFRYSMCPNRIFVDAVWKCCWIRLRIMN